MPKQIVLRTVWDEEYTYVFYFQKRRTGNKNPALVFKVNFQEFKVLIFFNKKKLNKNITLIWFSLFQKLSKLGLFQNTAFQ